MSKKIFVCIAGIDGSGKTTVSSEVLKKLGGFKYVWARWEPFFLKPFIQYLNKKTNEGTVKKIDKAIYLTKKGLKKKILKSQIVKKTWLFLAECDYFLQLIFKVLIPAILNKRILCDRYVYDFYLDQLINIEESPQYLSKFIQKRMLRVFPKPDLLVYIKVAAETGHRRKNDGTSVAYLKERKDYYDILKTIYKTVEVDGEENLETVVDKVYKEICLIGSEDYA